jgi:hypothetical protein
MLESIYMILSLNLFLDIDKKISYKSYKKLKNNSLILEIQLLDNHTSICMWSLIHTHNGMNAF